MEVNAKISKEWRRRMLFMWAMIFGIAAWFLTDGYILWPSEAERYEKYAELRDELIDSGKAENEESVEIRIAWQEFAKDAGLAVKVPKERKDAAIKEQRVIGGVMMTFSLLYAIWIAWNHRLSIRAEGETIIGASGQRVEIDWIFETSRRKWKDKGIAYAFYEEGGKRKRLILDEHKFKGCEAILLEAERRIEARKGPEEKSDEES